MPVVWNDGPEEMPDLHQLRPGGEPLRDYSVKGQEIEVFFRNLERHLIEYIAQADVVIGCVAWLTSIPILRALAQVPGGVSIIVQKEDFLRPDLASGSGWRQFLHDLYDNIHPKLYTDQMPGTLLGNMSPSLLIDPIRCVGNNNATKVSARALSHNKFVLFCKKDPYDKRVKPQAVWTGSFNFTNAAKMSFENAVVLRDPVTIKAFYREYAQIAVLSERLDWTTDWVEPEWRYNYFYKEGLEGLESLGYVNENDALGDLDDHPFK
jgi:phosphatidylserine/phosphatidylglycerophosphate/cardiolipin synthase-like enzyme